MSEKNKKQHVHIGLNLYLALGIAVIGSLGVIFSPIYEESVNFLTILEISLVMLLLSAYPSYKCISKMVTNSQAAGSLWIALVSSLIFFSAMNVLTLFNTAEEASVSWRFRLTKGKKGKGSSSLDGKGFVEKFDPPENARKDIRIIGIKTETVNKLQWPIKWQEYAKIIKAFKKTSNWLFFDIFFIDYKQNGQVEAMADALTGSKNVLLDYSVETDSSSKASTVNFEERLEILRKYRLKNVVDPQDKGITWLELAVPPIAPIASKVNGLGFANINKEEGISNRRMPLVAKLKGHGPNRETEFYPSIDLVTVCAYYGVDVVKDTEVVMGKYIKIKNIPNKQIAGKDIMYAPNPEREIVIPIDYYGQMLINFVGALYSFQDEDLYDVANDWTEETASQFENTIFLIAMYYATGIGAAKDTHLSPHGEMSGIEHHAHTLNTILNQDFIRESSKFLNLFLILFFGLTVGVLQHRLHTAASFGLWFFMSVIYLVLAFTLFFKFNFIIPVTTPLITMSFVFVGIIGYKILTEEENVKYIRNTFSKFVSKDVVDELLRDPDKIALGGSRKEITVFFSDVRGFTTLSEALSPEDLVKLLNEYLSVMTNVIIDFKGTIDKYMGDAIMAFWGAPINMEDHAYYACVSAIVQLNKLKELQADWKSRNLPSIDIGIGLNTGPAVVGNMGSSHRMDYTCMGDTVNLGSRLEGSNKMYATRIIISEYTYERVKERVYARELDLVKVKGKNQPVRIYELIGLVDDNDAEKLVRQEIVRKKENKNE